MDLEKIEKKGLEPLLSLLKKFGGWPVLEDNWNEANFKWYAFIYYCYYLRMFHKVQKNMCSKLKSTTYYPLYHLKDLMKLLLCQEIATELNFKGTLYSL